MVILGMPRQNFLVRNWRKQLQVALANIMILRHGIDQKAVHDLRVAIKKLRSYTRLSSLVLEADWKQELTETDRLFAFLGKQRDLQIACSMVEKLEKENITDYSFFRLQLHTALDETTRKLREAIKDFDESELNDFYRKILTSIASISNEKLAEGLHSYITQHMKKISSHQKNAEKYAHDSRKLLKDISYWVAICPATLIPAPARKKMDKLLSALGEWQDLSVILGMARHFRRDFLVKHDEEFSAIKELENSMADRRQQIIARQKNRIHEITALFSPRNDRNRGRTGLSVH